MNILIYDELPLFIHGVICRWADLAPSVQVIPTHSEDEIWQAMSTAIPEVIILDVEYDQQKKLDLLLKLKLLNSAIPVLINLRRIENINLVSFLEKGIAGVILKQMTCEEILQAVRWVGSNRIYLPGSCFIDEYLPREGNVSGVLRLLSHRQREILDLLAQGQSNKQICRRLGIAEGTVKNHLHALFRQLGVKNRTEAALKMSQVCN